MWTAGTTKITCIFYYCFCRDNEGDEVHFLLQFYKCRYSTIAMADLLPAIEATLSLRHCPVSLPVHTHSVHTHVHTVIAEYPMMAGVTSRDLHIREVQLSAVDLFTICIKAAVSFVPRLVQTLGTANALKVCIKVATFAGRALCVSSIGAGHRLILHSSTVCAIRAYIVISCPTSRGDILSIGTERALFAIRILSCGTCFSLIVAIIACGALCTDSVIRFGARC